MLSRIGALALLLGPLGYRLGVVGLGPAFGLFGVGFLLSLVTLPIALVIALVARRTPEIAKHAVLAAVLTLIVLAVPAWTLVQGAGAPPMHDITTDTEDPPRFDAVVPLRGDGSNPLKYSSELADVQRRAYPDIRPLLLPGAPDEVFDRSEEVVRELGWEIVSTDRQSGRIEATDVTFWFGFKDDVIVRIRPVDGGTRVDLRSVSRVGGGDVGANAARIRSFARQMLPPADRSLFDLD